MKKIDINTLTDEQRAQLAAFGLFVKKRKKQPAKKTEYFKKRIANYLRQQNDSNQH